jgi:hypothetical protein
MDSTNPTRRGPRRNRAKSRRILPFLATVASCLSAAASVANAGTGDAEPSWIPYLDVGIDSGEEIAGASVTSTVTDSASGTNSFDHARLRFGVGVLMPSWTKTPGRPRLFVQGGIDYHLAGSQRALDVGNVGDPQPAIDRLNPNRPNDRESIPGQGQRIRQEYMGPGWLAAIGVAFEMPAPWDDGSIRLKPMAAYEGERIRIEGQLVHVSEPSDNVFVVDRAHARGNPTTDHRLGLGGEIELTFFEGDRFEMSAYGNARYLWVVSGRSTRLGSTPTGIATFEWRQDANVVRGGLGIRVSWTGLNP